MFSLKIFLIGFLLVMLCYWGVKMIRAYRSRGGAYHIWMSVLLFFLDAMLILDLYDVTDNSRLDAFTWLLNLLAVPICGNLIFELVALRTRQLWKKILCFVPFVLCIPFVFWVDDPKLYYEQVFLFTAVASLAVLVYFVWGIHRYNKALLDLYSSTENRELSWLYWVLALVMALDFVWIWVGVFFPEAYISYYTFLLLEISLIVYCLHSHKPDAQPIMEDVPTDSEAHQSGLTDEKASIYEMIATRLEDFEKDREVYCNPNFTIRDMAIYMKTNRTYMSQYLNREKGLCFYDYVNGLRLQYACELLRTTDEPVEQISDKVGFASVVVFRRYLREQFHCSPTEYRENKK